MYQGGILQFTAPSRTFATQSRVRAVEGGLWSMFLGSTRFEPSQPCCRTQIVGELKGLSWSAWDYSRYIAEITPNMVGGKAKVTSTVAYHVMYWTLLPFLELDTYVSETGCCFNYKNPSLASRGYMSPANLCPVCLFLFNLVLLEGINLRTFLLTTRTPR